MDQFARPIIPPAPHVPPTDLPTWLMVWQISRNTLATWPDYSFDVLTSRARVLGVDSFVCHDPEGIRQILITNHTNYVRPVAMARPIRPAAGDGVLLSEGARWRTQRRMLSPVFSPANVGSLLPHFQRAGERLVRRLEGRTSANLSDAFHDATLDAVLRALFSLSADGEHRKLADMVRAYLTGAGRPTLFDGLAKRETDFAFMLGARKRFQTRWFAAVDAIIRQRKALDAAKQDDLLGMLLAVRDPDTGAPLPDTEVRDECATMLAAGFETTSRLLFWATHLLSLDQEEQGRLRAEIARFTPDRVTTLEDLQHWPRLRNVLLEALRLYPPAGAMLRDTLAEDVVSGERLGPGVRVWISPWVMHRHRKFWDHPTAFAPDRFAGQTSPWTSCGPFIPFGGGQRICIGAAFSMAEAQIMLATLLSRYEISLKDTRPVLPVGSITTGPNFEPQFRLEPVAA